MKSILIPIFFIFPALSSHADELVRSRAYFETRGYKPVRFIHSTEVPTELGRDLPWPVKFADASHAVAQNYVNFQEYDANESYFHGGCDLRSPGNSDVVASVGGTLEGGFYGYVTNADGSMEKQWQPWSGRGKHDPYFELAIVTDDGYRFEYHHVDSEKLPPATIAALNAGSARVTAGTVIGKVNAWAFAFEIYAHIHYNIIRSDGLRMNPEFFSVSTPDHTAPSIQGVYGLTKTGRTISIKNGDTISDELEEIVVATTESHDLDAYVQTPPFASIAFEDGVSFAWDFRQSLQTQEGKFPAIWSVFKKNLTLPNGGSLWTSGQYGQGLSLIRLPVSAGAAGAFTIAIGDTAGNQSRVQARIGR